MNVENRESQLFDPISSSSTTRIPDWLTPSSMFMLLFYNALTDTHLPCQHSRAEGQLLVRRAVHLGVPLADYSCGISMAMLLLSSSLQSTYLRII